MIDMSDSLNPADPPQIANGATESEFRISQCQVFENNDNDVKSIQQ